MALKDSKPIGIDDGLFNLSKVDYARDEEPSSDRAEESNGPVTQQVQVKPSGKSYECPHCDFIAIGIDSMKLYEEAVRHKSLSHKDIPELKHNNLSQKDIPELIKLKSTSEKDMQLQCTLCDYVAKGRNARSKVNRHKKSHHEKIREFQCTMCSYETKDKHHMKAHQLVHLNIRPFKCSLCSYAAKSNGNLKTHVNNMHIKEDAKNGLAKIKAAICTKCGFKTASSSNLGQHIKAVHEGVKNNKCDQCDYATFYKRNLKEHVEARHGEKRDNAEDIQCQLCEFTTSTKRSLQRHNKSTHAPKDKECNMCGYKTYDGYRFNRHMKLCEGKGKKYFPGDDNK